ncbi:MAG: type II toxin-antitoxin system Phd/YefM family antitoxin [Candidatus Omnitrophota bacterium]|nr:MAG: type II toxin-antitoxin system Phd/YefM family antitoxin [Candidatus Omnitrophota bacterium]
MYFITIRDLRNKSAKIQRDLPKEKEMVLTSNGKPIAILVATSTSRVEESLALFRRVRAMEAVEHLQRHSVEAGTNRISLKEINKEIVAERKNRQTK